MVGSAACEREPVVVEHPEAAGAECRGEAPELWVERPMLAQVQAVEAGEVCCAALSEAYLKRIEDDPQDVGAMITLAPDAQAQAAALDASDQSGAELRCAVIAVKDNIDVAGMPNTAGSLAMKANFITDDAPSMARLREAGALLVGKSSLSEWANFRGTQSSSGWSSVGGQTRNGLDPAYNPCGSSSGSAAAVAAGQVSAAIGTETSGSIVCPAAVNGVVGFKPTLGLVSRTGIIPIAHSFDTAGPIARTVSDAAGVLAGMAGPDPEDPATSNIPGDFDFDLVGQARAGTLSGVRLGFSRDYVSALPLEQQQVFEGVRSRLSAAGATLIEVELPSTEPLGEPLQTVLLVEFKAGLEDYLGAHDRPGVPTSLAEIITFNEEHAAEVMPHFGQEYLEWSRDAAGLDDPAYVAALERVTTAAGTQGLLRALDGSGLDAIVLPTMGLPWKTDYEDGDDFSGVSASFLPAAAGYPHLTVPMARIEGLSVGLSIIGRPWEDGRVLGIGHAFERLTEHPQGS